MKASIKYADGKILELEGTQEELTTALGALVGYGVNWFINTPTINVPTYTLPYCAHEYPNPWNGVVPPNCKKCGQPSVSYYTISPNVTVAET